MEIPLGSNINLRLKVSEWSELMPQKAPKPDTDTFNVIEKKLKLT